MSFYTYHSFLFAQFQKFFFKRRIFHYKYCIHFAPVFFCYRSFENRKRSSVS